MAITVKFLEELGIETEIAKKIFAERGLEVEKEKAKLTAVQNELAEKTKAFDTLNSEMETLKTSNASAEDWKTKFETLQAENAEKARKAEEERLLSEKNANNQTMFENAVRDYGKTMSDWNSPIIQNGYKGLFISEIEKPENVGKSHRDILHELTKDDPTAWKGVEIVKLAGGSPTHSNGSKPTKEEFAKMSYKQRLEIYDTDKELYNQLRE